LIKSVRHCRDKTRHADPDVRQQPLDLVLSDAVLRIQALQIIRTGYGLSFGSALKFEKSVHDRGREQETEQICAENALLWYANVYIRKDEFQSYDNFGFNEI
jgi:hypothetical protein